MKTEAVSCTKSAMLLSLWCARQGALDKAQRYFILNTAVALLHLFPPQNGTLYKMEFRNNDRAFTSTYMEY